ncbi:MAG: type IV pilus modification PilV family protein [Rudaea sp.]
MRVTRGRQCGMFLLEALVALVVFSLAMLGLAGVLGHALRESGNARWRGEAFELASSTLARMWVEDAATLAARYDARADGAAYRALLAAALRLPGVTADENVPVVTITELASGRRRARVFVYWRLPDEAIAHRASVSAVLPGT